MAWCQVPFTDCRRDRTGVGDRQTSGGGARRGDRGTISRKLSASSQHFLKVFSGIVVTIAANRRIGELKERAGKIIRGNELIRSPIDQLIVDAAKQLSIR